MAPVPYSLGERIEDYEVLDLLGKGGFASVYRAKCLKTGLEVAIKMIDKKIMQAARMVERVRQEVAIHSRLKHPAVLELFTFFENVNYVYLVLELCHNGELQRYFKNSNKVLSELEASHIMRQVVEGLRYLHSHNILHRDISLSNLLLSKNMQIKIADFGLATQLSRPDEKHLTMCGTPNYISPEVASRSSHGLEVDVWGLGCMLYTLLVGRPPFDTSEVKSTLTRVVMAKYDLPTYLSPEAKDLIDSLLKKNPKDRICINQILDHPFIKLHTTAANIVPGHSRLSQDSGVHTMSSKRGSVTSDCGKHRDFSARRVNSDCGANNHPIASGGTRARSRASSDVCVRPYQYNYGRSRSEERHIESAQSYNDTHEFNVRYAREDNRYNNATNVNEHILSDMNTPLLNMECLRRNLDEHKPEQISLFSQAHSNYEASSAEVCGSNHRCQHSRCSQNCCHPSDPGGGEGGDVLTDIKTNRPKYEVANPNNYDYIANHQQPQCGRNINSETNHDSSINVPQLCSFRLLPIRHQTKNAVLSILESGEVCIQFIKKRGRARQDLVSEVCLISPDGMRIVLYEPEGGKGAIPADKPPTLPQRGADAIFSYENLPEKHWKKYLYAAKFVDLVRAKTPKITYYSENAKCVLMENLTDFEACFYDGGKVTKSSTEGIKLIDCEGHSVSLSSGEQSGNLGSTYQLLWRQTEQCFDHCLLIERTLATLPGTTFPVIIGRRPGSAQPRGKENLQRTPQMPSFNISTTSTALSKMSSQRSRQSTRGLSPRRVAVPGVGTAVQFSNDEIRVRYPDGAQLFVKKDHSNIRYEWHNGHQCTYGPADAIPTEVKDRLADMSKVKKYLARPEQLRARPVR
ncbi:Sak kinase [Carabus blaptoides fortunei]